VRYFCDRSLGRRIPRELRVRGIDAVAHDDFFAQNEPDEGWLASVGQRGWIVLTKDDYIRYRAAERQAMLLYNVGCFVLMRRNDTSEQLLVTLAAAWDKIEGTITSDVRPFLYAIYKDGSIYKRDLPKL